VSFPVPGRDVAESRQRAATLAAHLGTSRLPVAVRVEPLATPFDLDPQHPLCQAFLRVGSAAEAELKSLKERYPDLEPLADRLVDEILSRRSR
jgi:hypothetical protein